MVRLRVSSTRLAYTSLASLSRAASQNDRYTGLLPGLTSLAQADGEIPLLSLDRHRPATPRTRATRFRSRMRAPALRDRPGSFSQPGPPSSGSLARVIADSAPCLLATRVFFPLVVTAASPPPRAHRCHGEAKQLSISSLLLDGQRTLAHGTRWGVSCEASLAKRGHSSIPCRRKHARRRAVVVADFRLYQRQSDISKARVASDADSPRRTAFGRPCGRAVVRLVLQLRKE